MTKKQRKKKDKTSQHLGLLGISTKQNIKTSNQHLGLDGVNTRSLEKFQLKFYSL